MELLKKRLAVLYSAGCTVGTLEILFNSESLHDFSMRRRGRLHHHPPR